MNEVKLCECGCGQSAPISPNTDRPKGYVKGQPRRFVNGHMLRRSPALPSARQTRACAWCGTEFTFWELDKTIYCSPACAVAAKNARPLVDRFWAKVDTSGGPDACWPWTGAADKRGYGSLTFHRRPLASHRTAYELTHGPIPTGLFVCHHCDNPPCCNPAHLFLGTPEENSADRDAKGRQHTPHGQRNSQAKLTEADVLAIRARYDAGECGRRLAEAFHVSPAAICNIGRRKNWQHL